VCLQQEEGRSEYRVPDDPDDVDGGKKCDDSQKKQQDMIYDFFKFMDVSDDQGVFLLFDVVGCDNVSMPMGLVGQDVENPGRILRPYGTECPAIRQGCSPTFRVFIFQGLDSKF
jgi:hypothetical protein